jgi:hypothetical protein
MDSSETLVTTYKTTRRHNPEEGLPQSSPPAETQVSDDVMSSFTNEL